MRQTAPGMSAPESLDARRLHALIEAGRVLMSELQLETVHLADAALVVLDGNLAHAQAARVVAAAADTGVPLAFEPVSVAKAGRLADGMIAAVSQVGKVLGEHFPRAEDDVNELPDRLIEV